MCGSSPDPDAVARSTGIDAPGFSAESDCTLPETRSISALFVGPRFDPPEAIGSYPAGPAADGPALKYPGAVNGRPTRLEPITAPSGWRISSPLACRGYSSCASTVTTSG